MFLELKLNMCAHLVLELEPMEHATAMWVCFDKLWPAMIAKSIILVTQVAQCNLALDWLLFSALITAASREDVVQ